MRRAYDSTNPYDIPTSAPIVAGYIDGIYRWSAAGWSRFPNAVHVRIACFSGTNDGQVLDVETGDAFPWEAPGWVLARRAAGVDPTVYVNWSNWGPTRTEFQHRGIIPEPHYWLASYDGRAEVPAGTVAKQYANSVMAGGHYDLSAVADFWPGVDRPGSIAPTEVIVTATIDDVYNLLDAVNKVTLKRIEEEAAGQYNNINGVTLLRMEGELKDLQAAVAALKLAPPPSSPVDLQPVLDAIKNLTLKAS